MVGKIGSRFLEPRQQKLINEMEPWVGIEPTHTLLQSVALPFGHQGVAGETGLEPATSGVTGQRSTLLNYSPTSWSAWWASNPRPSAWQADALPIELHTQGLG